MRLKQSILLTISIVVVSGIFAQAQVITIDPVLSGAVLAASEAEKNSWNDVTSAQKLIIAAQTATTAVVDKVTQIQNKIYFGLTQVSDAVKDGYSMYEIAILVKNIAYWESRMIAEAAKHPVQGAFAYKMQTQMAEQSAGCVTDISQFILKAKDTKLLMNAGERAQLLFNVKEDLTNIELLAMSSYYLVHWVIAQGIINSLNPFAGYVNMDKQDVSDILSTWKH